MLKERIDAYNKFSELLRWRNEIVHHGAQFEEKKSCWSNLNDLTIGLVWSLIDVMRNYSKIIFHAKDSGAINNFYHRQKLAPKSISKNL